MLPVLISFPTLWAMVIAVAGGVLYSAWVIWQNRKAKRELADFYGVLVGIGLAVAARVYGKPVPLHTYGLLVAGAFLIGTWLVSREIRRLAPLYTRIRKKKWISDDDILDLSFWILIAALVGSRVLFIIVNWDDYAKNPRNIFSLSGGLVFYGGVIGAISASIWFARRRKIPFFELADAVIPNLAFGHVMGRLGCFAAGCCFGKLSPADYIFNARFGPDSLAYSTELREGLITAADATSLPLHPTQLYEATGELAIFFLLLLVRSRLKRFHGQVLLTYFIVYAMLRTSIEVFRGDYERGMLLRWPADNPLLLSTSQTISIGFALTGAALLVYLVRKRRPAAA